MFNFSRIFIAYVIAATLALILGYLVSSLNALTFLFLGMVFFVLVLPILIRWHHPLLIFFWSSAFSLVFLPGTPDMWFVMAILSFSISFLNHILFQKQFLRAPELTRPLIFLFCVVAFTAWYRGGIGIRALGGGAYGGRYYYFIFVAIAGYFALTSEQIPLVKGEKMTAIFFLSGMSSGLSNVVYMMGPAFYFLFYFIPAMGAYSQALSDAGMADVDRIESLPAATTAVATFLLMRFGIRGVLDFTKPWRFALMAAAITATFFGGFRSAILVIGLTFCIQFYYEGLMRTHYLPIVMAIAIAGIVPLVFFSSHMPGAVQRAISFLPVNIDASIRDEAKGSSEWRFQMWAEVVKQLPNYLIIGKGYQIDPGELAMVTLAQQLGLLTEQFEGSMISGDYHSGPLSVIVPFGIFGTFGFLWMLYGGYQVLRSNYRFGDARLRRVNTTILAVYLTKCISFFLLFGAFNTQLYFFTGLCGLSVSINGGVRRRVSAATKPAPAPSPSQALAMEPG